MHWVQWGRKKKRSWDCSDGMGEKKKQHHHKCCESSLTKEKQGKQEEYNQSFCHQSGKQLPSPSLSLGYILLLNFVETFSFTWQGCTLLSAILLPTIVWLPGLGGTCVKVLITCEEVEKVFSCWTTNAWASDKPAREALFPSPTGPILFL